MGLNIGGLFRGSGMTGTHEAGQIIAKKPNWWDNYTQRFQQNMAANPYQPESSDMEQMPVPQIQMQGIIPRQTPMYQPNPYNRYQQPLFRRYGGPVKKHHPYVVGENGPELIVPAEDGTVIPNDEAAKMPWVQTLGGTTSVPNDPNLAVPPPMPTAMGTGSNPDDPALATRQRIAPTEPAPPPIGGNQGLFRGTTSPQGGPATSAGTYQQIQDLDTQIAATGKGQDINPLTGEKPREHSLWKRFGKGLVNAYKNWDGQGGLGGLLVSTVVGGIGSAASPQAHQVSELKNQQGKLFRQYGQAQAYEMDQGKQRVLQSQADENYNQIANRNAQTTLQESRIEAQRKKDEAAGKAWKTEKRNGRFYKKFPDGHEEDLIDPRTGKQEVEDLTVDQAKLNLSVEEKNRAIRSKNAEKLSKWDQEKQEHRSKVSQLRSEGQQMQDNAAVLEAQAKDAEASDDKDAVQRAAALRKDAAELRAKGNASMIRGNELEKDPPPKPTLDAEDLEAPNLSAKPVTMSELEAMAKKSGKTIDQMKQQARASGYKIQ